MGSGDLPVGGVWNSGTLECIVRVRVCVDQ